MPVKPFHARTFDDDDDGRGDDDDDDGDRSTLQHIFSSRLCPSVSRSRPFLSSQPGHISSIRSCERRRIHDGAGRVRIFTGKLIFICRSHPGRLILIKRSVIWVIRTVVRDSGPTATTTMDGRDEMRKNLNDYFTVVIIISPGVNLDAAHVERLGIIFAVNVGFYDDHRSVSPDRTICWTITLDHF